MHVSWASVEREAKHLADRWRGTKIRSVYGIPRGGIPVAIMVAQHLGVPLTHEPGLDTLVVDDLVDSGVTLQRYPGQRRDALYRKALSPPDLAPYATLMDGWVVFPWEEDDGLPTDAVRRLLQHLGEDPDREGLQNTPTRVVKALTELTSGYRQDPAAILATTFDVAHDQMIHVAGITVHSLCEHHMLPFIGTAHVAYVPTDRVVGLSKIPRVVHAFARRLQVQERLTDQIADAIAANLNAKGVGVRITAHHACMGLRGVQEPAATMTTTALRGAFFDPAVRDEFLREQR